MRYPITDTPRSTSIWLYEVPYFSPPTFPYSHLLIIPCTSTPATRSPIIYIYPKFCCPFSIVLSFRSHSITCSSRPLPSSLVISSTNSQSTVSPTASIFYRLIHLQPRFYWLIHLQPRPFHRSLHPCPRTSLEPSSKHCFVFRASRQGISQSSFVYSSPACSMLLKPQFPRCHHHLAL